MIDRTGQQLGNYRLLRPLGRGGFAEVYLGEHVHLNTPAAIKLLYAQLGGDDKEPFLKEARTIARLIHPNIVRVLDFGIESDTPFLVMDYAPNGTLRQRHARGAPLPPATIVSYVKQVADALQFAHDEKLIHRDIKPENMLIGRRNEILLSDFGIAIVAQSSRYQGTQDVIGTIAYMAPEQIQAHPRPASDQYSLGVIVYEWLTGERPFSGTFTELCAKHVFASPPSLREKIPNIPPAVEQVMMTALAKDPKDRFGSVRAFANAFEQAVSGVTVTMPPTVISPISQPLAPTERVMPPAASLQPNTGPTPIPPTVLAGAGVPVALAQSSAITSSNTSAPQVPPQPIVPPTATSVSSGQAQTTVPPVRPAVSAGRRVWFEIGLFGGLLAVAGGIWAFIVGWIYTDRSYSYYYYDDHRYRLGSFVGAGILLLFGIFLFLLTRIRKKKSAKVASASRASRIVRNIGAVIGATVGMIEVALIASGFDVRGFEGYSFDGYYPWLGVGLIVVGAFIMFVTRLRKTKSVVS